MHTTHALHDYVPLYTGQAALALRCRRIDAVRTRHLKKHVIYMLRRHAEVEVVEQARADGYAKDSNQQTYAHVTACQHEREQK